MHALRRHGFTMFIAVCALGASAVHAGELKLEKGFTRLDNGKNLDGWTGRLEGWSVVDGAIHLDAKKARGSVFSKTTHSKNCIIRLQFRATQRADSGVFIYGKQLQVRDYPNTGPKRYAKSCKPAGQWNDLEWNITDGTAKVRLNGEIIEKAWPIGNKTDRGVGLQKEIGDFDFRYVRLKEKK